MYPAAFMSIPENIDTSQVIWSADATDVDGDVLSYSLSGEDAGYFSVSALGAVSFNESRTMSLVRRCMTLVWWRLMDLWSRTRWLLVGTVSMGVMIG